MKKILDIIVKKCYNIYNEINMRFHRKGQTPSMIIKIDSHADGMTEGLMQNILANLPKANANP